MNRAATFHRASSNRKLAPLVRVPYEHKHFKFRPTPVAPYCSSTYVSIQSTCPESCAFKRGPNGEQGGCYIDADHFMRRAMEKLDGAGASGEQAIDEEIALIDKSLMREVREREDEQRSAVEDAIDEVLERLGGE